MNSVVTTFALSGFVPIVVDVFVAENTLRYNLQSIQLPTKVIAMGSGASKCQQKVLVIGLDNAGTKTF